MLKQYHQFVLALLVAADALAVSTAWLASYWLRFAYLPVDEAKGVPALGDKFLPMLPLVVLGHLVIFSWVRLYRPRRSEGLWREVRDIVKAFLAAVAVVVLIDYLQPEAHKISRGFIATYAVVGTSLFVVFRLSVRAFARSLRQAGFNQRSAVIVGTGRNAQQLLRALQKNRWIGMDVVAFVDDVPPDVARRLRGIPVRGPLGALRAVVDETRIDCVFVALPAAQAQRVNEVLDQLSTSMADVRLVSDLNPLLAMRPTVSTLDGLPILSLRQTPHYGSNALVKRGFDLVVGTLFLFLGALPMLIIAALVKLGSPGPVLYRQRRMGLDGQEFDMLKFRTLRVDAEADGPQWRPRGDRRTTIGTFLRKTSLDELPNLFNVLAGHMSLVGPRPERPEFIREFKHEIRHYMLRHKMKAGMTGYAQIRGYRGDTSLSKRIQHDLHYIRNWSLGLDCYILFMTIFGVWFSRHEADAGAASTAGPDAGLPPVPPAAHE
ncbi:MAG: undecaprenyl-phosphate glucose phosphotransferase [Phycisphaerales bacterium]|nr:undecaprenyl-phosphate glucose phosphotransferase [Phycisphaerales bacterium]